MHITPTKCHTANVIYQNTKTRNAETKPTHTVIYIYGFINQLYAKIHENSLFNIGVHMQAYIPQSEWLLTISILTMETTSNNHNNFSKMSASYNVE